MDEINRKETQKLADKGFAHLKEGEYEEALEISIKLEKARYSAAFDIGAQAHAGLSEYDEAINLLRKGLEYAPQAWLNWQLLGNYLSDLDKFDEAKKAFERALDCEGVWEESIYLNQVILSNRVNEYSKALNISKHIKDEELYLYKTEADITALAGLNLLDEAIELANQVLSTENYPEKDEDVVSRISAKLGQIYLKQGKSKSDVRAFALHSLSYCPNNSMLFVLIRDIDNRYSDKAKYYRALIHCAVPMTSPDYEDTKGYYSSYDVIAESIEDLLSLVKQFEEGVVQGGNYSVDEYEILEENSKDPCGVL